MDNSTPTQIHGHEVIALMQQSGVTYNRSTLIEAILRRFGLEARFHTCSAEDMSADELVDLLAVKGKFMGTPEAFTVNPERLCRH
jgi:probable metal-binding protein